MRFTLRLFTTIAALLIVSASAAAQARQGVMGELLKDVTDVETKVIGLAKAMPESAWAWRPSAGARTTSEVFLHIAADNYFCPDLGNCGAGRDRHHEGVQDGGRLREEVDGSRRGDGGAAEVVRVLEEVVDRDSGREAGLCGRYVRPEKHDTWRLDHDDDAPPRASGTAHRLCALKQRRPTLEQVNPAHLL